LAIAGEIPSGETIRVRATSPSTPHPDCPERRIYGSTTMSIKITRDQLTGTERTFDPDEFIVSKTDLTGRITYANQVFLKVAGYSEDEVLAQPHSLVRHPDMPRCVFQLLWDRIGEGKEIFAYVVNTAKNGDHYWVFAHVTPSFDEAGNVTGFHSNRRLPRAEQIEEVKPLYRQLCDIEESHADRKAGLEASKAALAEILRGKGVEYDEFVLTL
jgi:PAS domain S-box-containing protein